VRTGFPDIIARPIPVPSYFVLDTSITSLPHARDPFENVFSFQRCLILSRGRDAILVCVHGWRNIINRIRWAGVSYADSGAGVIRSEDTGTSSSPIRSLNTRPSVSNTRYGPSNWSSFGIPAYFVYFAAKVNPGVL
jgi:hypothetical protein